MDIQGMSIVSFNGLALNGTKYGCGIPIDVSPLGEVGILETKRSGSAPVYGGKEIASIVLPLQITIKPNGGGTFGELAQYFNTRDGATHDLIVSDGTAQWSTKAVTKSAPKLRVAYVLVGVYIAEPVWEKVTESSDTWNITASGDYRDIVVDGNEFAMPKFEITPTTLPAGYYQYRQYIKNYNPIARAQTDGIDITNGGWNTQALIQSATISHLTNGAVLIGDLSINVDTPAGGGLAAGGGMCYVASTGEQIRYTSIAAGVMTVYDDGAGTTGRGWGGTTAAGIADNVLLKQSKILASGADVRIILDGTETPRWFGGGGINSTTTQIFIRAMWKPAKTLTLRTAISNVGTPALLEFGKTIANRAFLKTMPQRGILRFDNEEFSYSGLNVANYTATVAKRALRGTAAATHAVGIMGYWVEHDIQLLYGSINAAVPIYSDVYKPIFDLATSTNVLRVNNDFADTANLRVGRFQRLLIDSNGPLSRVYSGNQAAEAEVDPATDAGMEIASYPFQGLWRPETADMAWMYYHPAGITSVSASGEKYKKNGNTLWPSDASLESSPNGSKWVRERNEAAPTAAATWQAWSFAGEAVPAGTLYIRFRLRGSVQAGNLNLARNEANSCTVALPAANVIQAAMNGEENNCMLSLRMANGATGEWFEVEYPVTQGETLIIDTQNFEITYRGVNALRAISDMDSIRTEWLRFLPGTNRLTYTATVTGNLTVVSKWRARSL